MVIRLKATTLLPLGFALLTACSAVMAGPTLDRVNKKGELVGVLMENYPPFSFLNAQNQLDGFDDRGDVKVIMATNKIETLDPALIRPGRIDRKILFENPDQATKRKIFTLHTSKMSLNEDVELEEFITQKDDLSGADIKAICTVYLNVYRVKN